MELFDAIVGVRKSTQGKIGLQGKEITNLSPREISQRGLASIPPDRIKQGLLMDFSVAENLIFGRQRSPQYRSGFLLNKTEIENFASASIKAFDIRTSGTDQKADLLSGGNLQKLILARELSGDISCVVASSPTRGLDVGATEFVHRRLLDLRQQGVGILLISEDLDEIFSLSDRIAVIFKGQIVGVYDSKEVTKEAVGLLMAGVGEDPK
jgi:simple sugar transport system ATP-binding protein